MPYIEIQTDAGVLRGMENAGTLSLLGVPYGASTAGPNRFRPPQPVEPWSGVRDALTFGPSAPQVDTRLQSAANGPKVLSLLYPRAGSPCEGASTDEDCLRLNIWAPSGAPGKSLPVLVWLHGGWFTHGSGNEMAFNGDILAQAGQMVVVTVTHRLGILGFLDLREYGVAGSANAGLLDIVAALQWVQRNIAAVGGDPGRVTISGQSGGSMKVAALHAMPAAAGLFRRAVMMSGPAARVGTVEKAAGLRERVMTDLGVRDVEGLRALSLDALLAEQAHHLGVLSIGDLGSLSMDDLPGFGPSLDPMDLPEHPFTPEATETVRDKDLMIGWTAHEAGLFFADWEGYSTAMTVEQVTALIDRAAPGQGEAIYAHIAAEYPGEPPHLVLCRAVSAQMMASPAQAIATAVSNKARRVWAYQFDQPTEVLGGLLGACHSLDLAYVFGTVERIPLTGQRPQRLRVAREVMAAWAGFVHDGDPSDVDPGWRPWTSNSPSIHHFGSPERAGLADPHYVDMAAPLARFHRNP